MIYAKRAVARPPNGLIRRPDSGLSVVLEVLELGGARASALTRPCTREHRREQQCSRWYRHHPNPRPPNPRGARGVGREKCMWTRICRRSRARILKTPSIATLEVTLNRALTFLRISVYSSRWDREFLRLNAPHNRRTLSLMG